MNLGVRRIPKIVKTSQMFFTTSFTREYDVKRSTYNKSRNTSKPNPTRDEQRILGIQVVNLIGEINDFLSRNRLCYGDENIQLIFDDFLKNERRNIKDLISRTEPSEKSVIDDSQPNLREKIGLGTQFEFFKIHEETVDPEEKE